MSRCSALHYDDDTYVELGPGAPPLYRSYDYGSTIPVVWTEVVALGRQLGAGDLDRFVWLKGTYRAVEEIEEELEEPEEEGEQERVAELLAALASCLPAYDPNEILVVVPRSRTRRTEGGGERAGRLGRRPGRVRGSGQGSPWPRVGRGSGALPRAVERETPAPAQPGAAPAVQLQPGPALCRGTLTASRR